MGIRENLIRAIAPLFFYLCTMIEQYGIGIYREKAAKTELPALVGRVVGVERERCTVVCPDGLRTGLLTGNYLYTAERADLPAVGDWVELLPLDDEQVVIQGVLPRYNQISRRASGAEGDVQIIAANIDHAAIVMAPDRDFSVNRLERYLAISGSEHISHVLLLSKADTISADEKKAFLSAVRERHPKLRIMGYSALSADDVEGIRGLFAPGESFCLLGSSGVGKTTLLNALAGGEMAKTSETGRGTDRGRHTTTSRAMFLLPGGLLAIDNPGMREVGVATDGKAIKEVFTGISALEDQCAYPDCTHTSEPGCAVLDALEQGQLPEESYENYIRMRKESQHYQLSKAEKNRKGKALSKILKGHKKFRKRNRW